MSSISDDQWFSANLDPETHNNSSDVRLPSLPPEEVQVRFTGAHGKANLQQAFDFYKFVLPHLPAKNIGQYRILDFGGGWGRVLRFFLREFSADRLVLVDCLKDAIDCAQSLNPPFQVVHTGINPPLPFRAAVTDCCIAFSVFSHLNESACTDWLKHLGELIVPGGTLIFTVRGQQQIDNIRRLQKQNSKSGYLHRLFRRRSGNSHGNALAGLLPSADEIEKAYKDARFVFYPTGGGGELSEDFYGEAWVSEKWIEDRYHALGFKKYQLYTEFSSVNQCVFVLTKK